MAKHAQGFTLLEMLAALIVLALLGAVAAHTLTGAFDSQRRMAASDQLAQVAQSKLDELQSLPLKAGVRQGTTASGVHWKIQVKAVSSAQDEITPCRVSLDLRFERLRQHYQTLMLGAEDGS